MTAETPGRIIIAPHRTGTRAGLASSGAYAGSGCVQIAVAVRAEKGRPAAAEADLPREVMGGDSADADAEAVDAVQVVRGADGHPVVARVVAAVRAVDHVVVLQARPGRARGHGASPAVALEDRVAMPGPSLPLGRRVAQKPLEALPRWRASRSERANRGPEERLGRVRGRARS